MPLFLEVECELSAELGAVDGCSPTLPDGTRLKADDPGPALRRSSISPLFSEALCLLWTTSCLPGGHRARAIWETHLLLCRAVGDSPGAEVVALVTHLSPQ